MAAPTPAEILDGLARERAGGADVATTSFNVVGFVENDDALLARLIDRAGALAVKHATRSIIAAGSRDQGEHRVTGDRIELGAHGLGAAELRSLVHDLLVPNVRTVLLWAGEHLTDPRFNDLASLADTIVLFSSARDWGLAPLRELVAFSHDPLFAKVRDLSYLRLYVWQDLVAQFFDDPELAAELARIEKVEISSGSQPEAYYLVAWLASRLGWTPCGKHELCNERGAAVSIAFATSRLPRRIESICLHSASCVFGACVEAASDDVVCLTVKGEKHRARRCMPLHDVDMVALIERAIFEPPARELYAQTLHMAARLLEHEG